MDSESSHYLARSRNELNLAQIILRISDDEMLQVEVFRMQAGTYYNAVIAHAYYSIFYAAKTYLLCRGIKTEAPEEHKKTFDAFAQLVSEGLVDMELLRIYERMLIRAETLLRIFELEKAKRGKFTYKMLPQANREPARESIANAQTFFTHIFDLCEERK